MNTKNNPKILLLDWSFLYRYHLLFSSQKLNADLYVVSDTKIDNTLVAGTLVLPDLYEQKNLKELLAEIIQFVDKNHITAVGTVEDELLLLAQRVNEYLGTESGCDIAKIHNKLFVRKVLKENGFLNQPDFSNANCIENKSTHLIKCEDFPLIVKPAHGNFSMGVSVANNLTSLRDCIKKAKKAYEFLPEEKPIIILEELIPSSSVVTVEGIVYKEQKCHIFGMTTEFQKKVKKGGEISYEYEYTVLPAHISNSDKAILTDLVEQVTKILNLNDIMFHMEFKKFHDKWYLIEINPRIAGGTIPYMYECALGIDLGKIFFKQLLKQTITSQDIKPNMHNSTIINFFKPSSDGLVDKVEINSLKYFEYINRIGFYYDIGDKYVDGEEYGIGYVMSTHPNYEKSVEISNDLKSSIDFKMKRAD